MKTVTAGTLAMAFGALTGIAALGFSPTPAAAQCQVFPVCDMCYFDMEERRAICTNCTFTCAPT